MTYIGGHFIYDLDKHVLSEPVRAELMYAYRIMDAINYKTNDDRKPVSYIKQAMEAENLMEGIVLTHKAYAYIKDTVKDDAAVAVCKALERTAFMIVEEHDNKEYRA